MISRLILKYFGGLYRSVSTESYRISAKHSSRLRVLNHLDRTLGNRVHECPAVLLSQNPVVQHDDNPFICLSANGAAAPRGDFKYSSRQRELSKCAPPGSLYCLNSRFNQ